MLVYIPICEQAAGNEHFTLFNAQPAFFKSSAFNNNKKNKLLPIDQFCCRLINVYEDETLVKTKYKDHL
jgi:hypothetical protein